MACPCAGARSRVRSTSMSSVPCKNSMRSFSSPVDILGEEYSYSPRMSRGETGEGARLFMGWFDIDSVFGLDLTAVYAVRYEHGRLSGSPLPRASTRRRVGPRSTHAPRFAIRSHDSVW